MNDGKNPLSDEDVRVMIEESFQAWVEAEVRSDPECFA